ncbi:MAG: hypothetical protein JXB26_00185 [Candidatus Aminicenantes bacterium]|nr:hypothetical protein [Candidatus Aminicenantes bacterium]
MPVILDHPDEPGDDWCYFLGNNAGQMKIKKINGIPASLQGLFLFIGTLGIYLLLSDSMISLLKNEIGGDSPYGFITHGDLRFATRSFAILFISIGFLSLLSIIFSDKILSSLKIFGSIVSHWLSQKKFCVFIALFLILLAFLVYFTSFQIGFHSNDYSWLNDSEKTSKKPSHIFSLSQSHFFKPVTHIYHFINYSLFKENPHLYHISGILLHGINSFLIFLICLILTNKKKLAIFASILFCTYPVSHRSVMWISANEIILAGLIYLLSLYLFLAYLKNNRLSFYILSAGLFIIGIFSKEAVISLAPVLFIAGIFFGKGKSKLSGVLFILFAAVFLIFQFFLQSESFLLEKNIYTMNIPLMLKNLNGYVFSSLLPQGHRIIYSFPQIRPIIFTAELILFAVLLFRGNYLTKFFLLWYIFLLLPFMPFNVPVQPRYLYLPSFALCILGGWFLIYAYKNLFSQSKMGTLAFHILLVFIISGYSLFINMAALRMKTQSEQMKKYIDLIKNDNRKIKEIQEGRLPQDSPLSYDDLKAALKL